jgi:rhamnogalacturonyl hydrolase YesR
MKKAENKSWIGDSATTAVPLASGLSPKLQRKEVRYAIQKVADWQLQKARPGFDQDWTFATLYVGFMAVPEAANGKTYQQAMLEMGKKFQWQPGPRIDHADDHAISQTYLDLFFRYHDPAMIAPTRERMDAVMRLQDNAQKPLWWWCDALFMGPAVLAKLTRATGDRKYLDFMDHEWWITSDLLYSPKDHLFFRDQSFFGAHEANGRNIFWSRGNGWVFAGLARVLAEMPADYPSRPRYVAQFREMAEKIASLQGADGLWRAGLLDQADYQLPENSGSAFYTFGFAYGINSGILDRKKYQPIVQKSWQGLLRHVYQDGRLGCIQPVGAAPGAFTASSSYVYGTGAFLLAGSEVFRLAH